jgi:hypothetical protein
MRRSNKRRRLHRGKQHMKLTMRRSGKESQNINAVERRRKSDASRIMRRRGRERRKGLLR